MTDYEVLGLKPSATYEEIKQRFHLLVKMNHPDKYDKENRDLWNLANERMTQITEAYRRLSGMLMNAGNTEHQKHKTTEDTYGADESGQCAGKHGESRTRDETEASQKDKDAHRRQSESQAKNDFIRKEKVERLVRNLRQGMSSYEDIHDLIPNWFFYKLVKSNKDTLENDFIASDDEVVSLILEWVQRSVVDNGAYTFNSPALLTLRRIESGIEFCLSDSLKNRIKACIESVAKLISTIDSKYGKLERTSSEYHFIKKQMRENGLKIGLKDESDRIDYCKYCRHCCYVQRFLHKDWCCDIRDKDGDDSVDGKLKVIPSFNSCGGFERRYPMPGSVSRRKLMQYGIIQHALSLGFCYVSRHDIESFGFCGDCAHYTEQRRYQEEKCSLRGQGDGHSSERWCCKSFLPRFPEYYIKLG